MQGRGIVHKLREPEGKEKEGGRQQGKEDEEDLWRHKKEVKHTPTAIVISHSFSIILSNLSLERTISDGTCPL